MTLQQLIYFKEVAKVKHFTRAAENLYVAQSSLSHAVQELESELGAPLFLRRNGKKVEITNYGEALLPYVDRALEAVNDGKRHLMDMIAPERGVVNIAYTYLNGCSIIQEVEDTFLLMAIIRIFKYAPLSTTVDLVSLKTSSHYAKRNLLSAARRLVPAAMFRQ